MITKRQGIFVWFQHRRNIKRIKRYGHLIYASEKLKYALLYVDQSKVEEVEQRLKKLPYISKIKRSYKPLVQTEFQNKNLNKIKPYDYNMGI